MARIDWVEDEDATGDVAEVYNEWKKANPNRPRFPDILKCFSPNPILLRDMVRMTYPLHFMDGALTRKTKEMIATYVSGLNQCPY